ncbi:MAG: YfdX family protein [Candidatus Thiodiazotropha sp.]
MKAKKSLYDADTWLVAALLLVTASLCTTAWADSKTITDRAVITRKATSAIRLIAQAQHQLDTMPQHRNQAMKALEEASSLLKEIHESLPTVVLKGRIMNTAQHLNYEKAPQVLPDLIPLFSSLSEIVDSAPRKEVRRHLDLAREALQYGREPEAQRELKAAGDALLYVETDLPLKSTRQRVEEALSALRHDDIATASKRLDQAQRQVVTISLSLQSPLTQARVALERVRTDHHQARKSVSDPLADARLYLRQAAYSEDKTTRQGAHELLREVNDLQRRETPASESYKRRLAAALARVTALSQRAADRIDRGWDRLHGSEAVKQDLIEARLRLAYARIDQLMLDRISAARVDLSEADSFLGSARTEADRDLESRLQDVSLDLAGLVSAIDEGRYPQDAQRYDQLQNALSHLISGL